MSKIFFVCFFLGAFVLQAQQRFTPELLWKLNRISGGTYSPDGKYVLYSQRSFQMEKNKGNTDLFVLEISTQKITQITNTLFSEMDAQWGVNNTIWFLSNEMNGVQLWKMNVDGKGKTMQTHFSAEANIEGFKIAPSEKTAVLLQAVKTKKTIADTYQDLPQVNARIEDQLMYRHWDHYQDEYSRHLFVYDITKEGLRSKEQDVLANELFDAILPPHGGMDGVCFSADESKIIYASKKMSPNQFAISTNSALYAYDLKTKSTQNLTESYKGYDNQPSFHKNGLMAWLSMARDGFESDKNDIIVKDISGKDINLTAKEDLSVTDYCWKTDGKGLYFLAALKGTVQLFEVAYPSGKVKQLSKGQHDIASISVFDDKIVVGKQSMIDPLELFTFNPKDGKFIQLTSVNKTLLEKVAIPSVRERWITTSDGQKMLAWVIYPPNFDSTKVYPTLLYCQGGPQSPVSQFFSYRWNFRLMASMGYIVIAPNRRGLPGFGQKWNDAISKDWGGQAIQDYLSAIDDISKEKYVDKDKLGAVGASYGGYSVYYLAGVHDNRFKTFISHCGLFNLESWYGTTEELFFANWDNMGPYWLPDNKAYYEKNSPHRLVENWNTPIMVIHGGMDFRVPESEGMQAYQVAQVKGIKSRYLSFPTEGHWVVSPQNGLLWQREFFRWLSETL